MALRPRYLADKSALARFNIGAVGDRLRPLLEDGLIATCAIVDLEVLYSSRNLGEYEAIAAERSGLPGVEVTPAVMTTALALQRELARRGQHRVPIPDLVISAAARHGDLTVLHYDRDFELITRAGGAANEWIAKPGSLLQQARCCFDVPSTHCVKL